MGKYMWVLVMAATAVFGVNAMAEGGCGGKAACTAAEVKNDGPKDRGQWFAKMDANSDGKVSKDEYVAAQEARAKKPGHEMKKEDIEARFAKMDKDSDGMLTQDEMKAGHDGKHGKNKKAEEPK